jgi:spermidine synthase
MGLLWRIAVFLFGFGTLLGGASAPAAVIFETTSPYHHVRVTEDEGMRILRFDDATETRMSIQNPLTGHFEYTEFFHLSWLWNTNLSKVLMIGLGGASAQRSFEHYYPRVIVESVEIDPVVVQVARNYFQYKESDRQKIHTEDGRIFLRRSADRYDLIVLDAYVSGRYGSSIPQHLATKEFFELVRDHLSTNGIVAYNVIGTLRDWHADIVGAIYRTLKTVFPQVYLFPAKSSLNVVLVGTRAGIKADLNALRQRANLLIQTKQVSLPGFRERLEAFQPLPPPSAARSPVLTDDYAPVEGLAAPGGK